MIYMKHQEHGNKHFPDSEQAEREAAGWVRWPRTPEQKRGVETKRYSDGSSATGTSLPDHSPAEQERSELEQQAAELGIKIDKRWGDKRLKAAIDDHRQ
jgi:hypothetical protein